MNTQIKTVHFDADVNLIDHVNKRLSKLPTFHDRITSVEIYLKLDNLAHQIKDKVAEIKIYIPRHQFFVKHKSKSFEESFDQAFESVVTQLKRYKSKQLQK